MWGYRHRGVDKEFADREQLVEWCDAMDPGVLRDVRYWHVETCFDVDEFKHDVADGVYEGLTAEDWLSDALDEVELLFAEGQYDWSDETICGIYYKEEEEE